MEKNKPDSINKEEKLESSYKDWMSGIISSEQYFREVASLN